MPLANTTRAAENVSSPLLPGGSLIAASLDRQVMIWSDRGGASRHIGDRWAVRSADALLEAEGRDWPVPYAESFRLVRVIRLDDVPEVSREANLHQLENPDFLLIGVRSGSDAATVVQATDAKFAADRIKPSQVSAEVVANLLAIEGGVTRALLDVTLADLGLQAPRIVRGVFACPESELTDYLLRKVSTNRDTTVDPREIVRVPAEPDTMFAGLAMTRLIGPLARLDSLPVTPRTNLISAIYYFRLACACMFLWNEAHRPLLSLLPISEPETGIVAAELAMRAVAATGAYGLVERWADDAEPQIHARTAIANVATLPIRMRDVRALIEQAGRGDEQGFIRYVRKELELTFRRRLIEITGEIGADDPRPLTRILDHVARAARDLRPEMRALLDDLVAAGRTIPEPSSATS